MASYPGMDPSTMGAMMGVYLIVLFVVMAFMSFLQWRVFSKAGYPGALGLVWLALGIPILNIIACIAVIVIWIWFAFSEWPVEKKAKGMGAADAMR